MSLSLSYGGKTVLVTGAGGYVGSALVAALVAAGAGVIRLSRGTLPSLAGAEDITGDPRCRDAWAGRLLDADIVFHLAGETSTYAALADPLASLEANVLPLVHLGDAFRRVGRVPVVVAASTCTLFGNQTCLPVSDETRPTPLSHYDTHKLMAEMQLAQDAREGFIKGCALRLSNVYGLSSKSQGAADRGILDRMVCKALNGEAITVYGDGSQMRDYVHLDDVVVAFLLAGVSPAAWTGEAMMVASGIGHSLAQAFGLVVERVAVLTGRNSVPLTHVPWPATAHATEFRSFIGDASWLRARTGWAPTLILKDGIDRTVRELVSLS